MYEIELSKLKESILSASNNLTVNKNIVNDLNVFPVPDGDTGTNMNMTIKSAVKVANESNSTTIKGYLKNFSKGSLLGARGNSGVILSQLIRGFVEAVDENTEVLTIQDLAKSINKASEVAYNAVMKPTEGTILTVSKDMAKAAKKFPKNKNDIIEFIEFVYDEGVKSLNRTPELLPILKESGVVDAGGKGLLCLAEGALKYLKGDLSLIDSENLTVAAVKSSETKKEYKYSLNFILLVDNIKKIKISEAELKIGLSDYCGNIKTLASDDKLDVSFDTDNPGKAIEKATSLGSIANISFNNKHIDIKETNKVKQKEYKNAFISVSAGDGFTEVFESLGVAKIISGGQTMNPSTEDLLSAVNELNAENIFILPNNSNIILAAEQVKSLSEKNVYVIPTRSMPEGVSAVFSGINEEKPELVLEAAKEAIENMQTGEITYAVRETKFHGENINEGDIIGITGKEIVAKGININEVTKSLINKLYNEDFSLISIYYGEDVSEEEANKLVNEIEEAYPDVDIELTYGGQPLYYYIISIE